MASGRRGSRGEINLHAIDLNLLVVFQALYRERSVTRAGRRLGLSQPATSAALARLRTALGDELFVNTPKGLEPTARCTAVAEPVDKALEQLRSALAGQQNFDPATAETRFNVGAVDAVLAVVLRRLTARVIAEAPRAQLAFRSIDPREAPAMLDRGDIDLAIVPTFDPPAHLEIRELFRVPLVLAARPDHPLSDAPDLAEMARYPHVMVSFAGPLQTAVDKALAAVSLQRRVAVVLSSFLAVPQVLASSDALAIVPEPFARELEAVGQLRCVALPPGIPQPDLRMRLLWPPRVSDAPAWRWLRGLIAELVAG